MTSQLCPNNERHGSVKEFRPSIFNNHGAVSQLLSIIEQSVASLGNDAYDIMLTMSYNELQQSVNRALMERQ